MNFNGLKQSSFYNLEYIRRVPPLQHTENSLKNTSESILNKLLENQFSYESDQLSSNLFKQKHLPTILEDRLTGTPFLSYKKVVYALFSSFVHLERGTFSCINPFLLFFSPLSLFTLQEELF
jgi:hypothetical protein